jgi:hypothetical protein
MILVISRVYTDQSVVCVKIVELIALFSLLSLVT